MLRTFVRQQRRWRSTLLAEQIEPRSDGLRLANVDALLDGGLFFDGINFGHIHFLMAERVPGGEEVHLPNFAGEAPTK